MTEITMQTDSDAARAAGREPLCGSILRAEPELIELPGYDGLKTCRRCRGICHREHVHVEDCRVRGQCIAHVYCDHCAIAWESLLEVKALQWEHVHTLVYFGAKLGAYLKCLENMTCAVA